jgi:hypothetical protein
MTAKEDGENLAVAKVRAAVKDRATWFALLYRSFSQVLPPAEVERLCREAIYEFGRLKAGRDPQGLDACGWVQRHVAKGSARVFDSEVQSDPEAGRGDQQMRFCPLVEAWQELACSEQEVALLCDIAMEGDRGRAEAHGLEMELARTIGKGDACCTLVLRDRSPAQDDR